MTNIIVMKKFEILWKLPKHDTETWNEQILLEKWHQYTCFTQGSHTPLIYNTHTHTVSLKHNKVRNCIQLNGFQCIHRVYSHYHCLISGHFHHPKKNTHDHWPSAAVLPSAHPPGKDWSVYFLSLWLCLFWTVHINGIIPRIDFWVWHLHLA